MPSFSPAKIDVTLNGDIELLVGTGETAIQFLVSSTVLKLVSPVFCALLGPNFKEGAPATSGLSRQISLPDDDPEAMTYICKLIHLVDVDFLHVTTGLLDKIATVCDKYDLVRTLRFWAECCLQNLSSQTYRYVDLASLLRCAIVFDSEKTFHNCTGKIMRHNQRQDHSFAAGMTEKCGVPWQLLAALETTKTQIRQDLENMVENTILYSIKRADKNTASHIQASLVKDEVWPFQEEWRSSTLYELVDIFQSTNYCKGTSSCSCKYIREELSIDGAPIRVVQQTDGLCLRCFKSGKLSEDQGNCHAEDSRRCKGVSDID